MTADHRLNGSGGAVNGDARRRRPAGAQDIRTPPTAAAVVCPILSRQGGMEVGGESGRDAAARVAEAAGLAEA
ncbi:MAG: hypothetical protein KIT36_20995, partial [Alphaproteobacteria bacterium]|nr:hypothetical protein [Alphaproteobacteria bacterium]